MAIQFFGRRFVIRTEDVTNAGGCTMSLSMQARFVVIGAVVGVALAACAHGHEAAGPGAAVVVKTGDAGAGAPSAPLTASDTSALEKLTEEEACRMNVSARGAVKPDAKPFSREDGTCEGEMMCDTADVPPKSADACFVATRNLTRAERAVRGGGGAQRATTSAAWDKKTPPKYWDKVNGHLHLGDREQELLRQNGFVALGRERYDSYAVAYHDVFQQQLPVYIGVDSIFNAVYQSSQSLLGEVEDKKLGPALARMLDRLRSTLGTSRARYDADTVADLQVYLAVAHRLLHGAGNGDTEAKPLKEAQLEALTASLVEKVNGASGLTEVILFGRGRMIDFSQFAPRGRYANPGYEDGFYWPPMPKSDPALTSDPVSHEKISPTEYFKSMMWLSRLELNVVSRSCRSSEPGIANPTETPREARDAIALADLVGRAGEMATLAQFETVYSVFAGRREDLSLQALASLTAKNHIGVREAEGPSKLKTAIGGDFKRTANTHFMPDGTTTLPVITTMFGPRIVPDVAPLTQLVHPAINERFVLGAADVGYVLGHDRARSYLGDDLKKHPDLGPALDTGRQAVAHAASGKSDVYSAWLDATLKLAEPTRGVAPSFTRTPAYADYRLNAALAGYAQIRHTFVLMAAQGYDMYGCEIPDGYVEPAVAVYDALLDWVRAARRAVPTRAAYFTRVAEILQTLRTIAATEAAGQPLTEPQKRWLGMVAEYTPIGGSGGDSGMPPKYTGWYFDMFPDREQGAERSVQLVADYFTLTNANQVRYLGIREAAMGVFVVDTSGEPRVMVGPVANAYETSTPIESRLDDKKAKKAENKVAPWQASYLAPERPAPDVSARVFSCADGTRVVLQAGTTMDASVNLLDHHGDSLGAPVSHAVGPSLTALAIALPPAMQKRGAEGVHIAVKRAAPADHWDMTTSTNVYAAAGVGGGDADDATPAPTDSHIQMPGGRPRTNAGGGADDEE